MNILIACATALHCVIEFGGAVSSPSILQLRIGMSSDSAIAIIGDDLARDTTWTGRVHRRVESITLRPVDYYGIPGELELTLAKRGDLESAQWTSGLTDDGPGFGVIVDLTQEDFENIADSLSVALGSAPDLDGSDRWRGWSRGKETVTCTYYGPLLRVSLLRSQLPKRKR